MDNHYRIINSGQNKKSTMTKFWSQKHNVLPEGMPQKINYQRRQMKYYVDLLNEETRKDRRKKKDLLKLKRSESQNGGSSRTEQHLSKHVKKMLEKIGKNVNHIKKSILDITKMNGLYLEDKAKKTFFRTHHINNGSFTKNNSAIEINRKMIPKKLSLKKNENENDINKEGNQTFSINQEDKNEKINKKDDYTKNFVYVNDNYRRQLNFAFLKYNSEQHLENLKFLVESDPSIREDINGIIQEVEKDIKWKCDKRHFAKKYYNLIEKYKRSRSMKEINEKNEKENNKNNKNILPDIHNNKKNLKNRTTTKNFKQKSFRKIYNQINYGMKYNKKELSKLNAQKEQTKEEMNHMLIASKEIDNFIQDNNINNKIDMFKTDYARQIYGYFSDNGPKESNLLKKDYFLDDKANIVQKIGNVFSFKMDKTVNEQEKMFKGKIYDEAKKFRKRIIDGKKNALDEFNGYITTYQIKLPNNNKNENEKLDINQTAL